MKRPDYILETTGLYKDFNGNLALDDVSISFARGEVHAICGENGAGKSTLMKVLCGVYIPEAGEITVNGKRAQMRFARDMVQYGISIIFQEFNLMNHLSIAENVFVTRLQTKGGVFLDKKKCVAETRKLLADLNIGLDPMTLVGNLSVSEKQMVEIVKALSFNAEIIIMDEPTAALNNREVEKLYEIIDLLKQKGKTIIYISHRMKEIFDLSDRVTVLRDGKLVATCETRDVDHDVITEMMVGRGIKLYDQRFRIVAADPVLEVRNLRRDHLFKDISFELNRGEILGISGLVGCGREDVAKALYSLCGIDAGEILLEGKAIHPKVPADCMNLGIMYLTDDRKDSGIFPHMGVGDNLIINALQQLQGRVLIRRKREIAMEDRYIRALKIKCASRSQEAMYLSGGNQQKVLMARSLTRDCKVLILQEPTRGVDIATKADIYSLLSDLSDQGISILVISSDLPEMITICDRILVMWQGEMVAEFNQADSDEHKIMMAATGKRAV